MLITSFTPKWWKYKGRECHLRASNSSTGEGLVHMYEDLSSIPDKHLKKPTIVKWLEPQHWGESLELTGQSI